MPSNDLGVYSHFPILAAAVAGTTGPVLELGCGWGSTPMLEIMCRRQRRVLESYETDEQWAGLLRVSHVPNWEAWTPRLHSVDGPAYSVAFIDCAPGEVRGRLAVRLRRAARFILLHDALSDPPHGGGNYRYDEIVPEFRFVEYYRVVRPATLILSDDEPFGLSEEEQRERIVL